MSRLLFLTQRMLMGYGVERVLHEVAVRLTQRGHELLVLTNETDDSYRGPYRVVALERGTVDEVAELAAAFDPAAAIACTTPFFEMLPVLRHRHPAWAWEHGDPSPEFFSEDGEARERIKRDKIDFCYPVIDGVLAISEFIRSDIEWPAAYVVYDGCDHAPDLGSKGLQDLRPGREPLRVGTLMRLGSGEARYKGNEMFLSLVRAADGADCAMEFRAMGRGSDEDARELRAAGCEVVLNANDDEKWRYLRSLDAFVSCSLWEGFNLPLAEAQAVGTLGLAFDTGAHPEVTPLVFGSVPEMMELLKALERDRELVLSHSRAAYHYVRQRFTWDRAADALERHVLGTRGGSSGEIPVPGGAGRRPPRLAVLRHLAAATIRSARREGLHATLEKVRRRLGSRGSR